MWSNRPRSKQWMKQNRIISSLCEPGDSFSAESYLIHWVEQVLKGQVNPNIKDEDDVRAEKLHDLYTYIYLVRLILIDVDVNI